MRYADEDEAKKMNAAPWQLALLNCNPGYCSWGPHEDYMSTRGDGWNSAQICATWQDFGPWGLDDLNECVNFYFEVNRANVECPTCNGDGYHPRTRRVVNTFYRHQCESVGAPESEAWNDKITQDEADYLIAEGRGKAGMTAEQFNAQNAQGARGWGHDAINRHLLIRARLKRLGLPEQCPQCDGEGFVYTAPAAHVSLILWMLHPRKGCSRGVEITRIEESDLPVIQEYLATAAQRNADRFAGIQRIQVSA